jgi:propanediol utilization protein
MTPNAGNSHPPGRESLPSDASVHQLPPAMLPAEGLPVRIPVVVSMRHAHLTAAIIEQLFCDRYRLHPSGVALPGQQFATLETVDLVGPQGRLRKVQVIGPPRAVNQIEISRADALILGIRVPVRESGDLIGTPGLTVRGPRSQVALGTGVICALRHVHINPEQAKHFGLKDRDRVEVATQGINRRLCFQDVLVRVGPHDSLELHLDTDEANAAGVRTGDFAVLTRRIGEAPR